MDEFFLEKIRKKLEYRSVVHLLLARRWVRLNINFHSIVFIQCKRGGGLSKKVVNKCKTLIWNILWLRNEHHTQTRMNKNELIWLLKTLNFLVDWVWSILGWHFLLYFVTRYCLHLSQVTQTSKLYQGSNRCVVKFHKTLGGSWM